MNDCITVFETLKGFLPLNIMEKYIDETNADHGTKKFTVLKQLNTLMYAHLTEKSSLREIAAGIKADEKLQQHTGDISHSQMSRKNSSRDPQIFKMIFDSVLSKLRKHNAMRTIPNSWGALKILDATIIRLCVSLFPWARYRQTTAAVKMHTLYDLTYGCPDNIVLTEGVIHDKEKMSSLITTPGITYIFDRGYIDYKQFDKYCEEDIFFITRLKKNAVMKVLSENTASKSDTILSDKKVILGGASTKMHNSLRVVEVIDSTNNEPFYIATSRFDLTAEEIGQIYRLRWQIELFFKWIKQHLKIKKFYGTSFNAVLNQIYAALILFCLLKFMHIQVGLKHDFLKLVRTIANGLWNTMSQLKEALLPRKPPRKTKRKRFNWQREYVGVLVEYCLGRGC